MGRRNGRRSRHPAAVGFAAMLAAGPLTGAPLAAQDPAADTARAAPVEVTPEQMRSAYLDPGAREMVERARERRATVDRSIEGYEARAAERLSVGLRALWRERLLWRREVATRIEWERDGPVLMEVLGARDVFPMFVTEPQMPSEIGGWIPRLAFDPADPYLVTGWGAGDGEVPHPLAAGAEAHYRFRSGDTTVISLPDGREVRLIELEVIPRRRAWNLVQGSFWLESRTHAVARVTVRPSEPYDIEEDGGDDVPGIIGDVRFTVEYVTIDYALWELEWWLPRLYAIRGSASIGRFADVPFSYERTYSRYDVRGQPGTAAPVALEASPYAPGARVRCPTRGSVRVSVGPGGGGVEGGDDPVEGDAAAADTLAGEVPDTVRGVGVPTDTTLTEEQRRECARYTVVLAADTASLISSPELPESAFQEGEALLTEAEIEDIRERLEGLSPPPFRVSGLDVDGPLGAPGLVRYNKIEGLSAGARAGVDLGPARVEATARIGEADLEPNGELAVLREGPSRRLGFAAYRRLEAMDPLDPRPFSLGNSLSALLLGEDDLDYFRTLGLELTGEPAPSRDRTWAWRAYARQERPAAVETDVSVARLFDRAHVFSPTDSAADATQYGAAVRLRRSRGLDPLGFRIAGELGVEAATGTYDWGRAFLAVRMGFPLPGSWVGTVEGAAGSSAGGPAIQHLWRIGGPATLRGYDRGALVGEAFWRGRAEVATELPAFRLVLFSDAGWAGASWEDIPFDAWLMSGGVGVSLLDGLVRLDVARALKSPTGWRLSAYLDGWL